MSEPHVTKILVLGAGGLIGGFIANDLMRRGFPVIAVARKFTAAQRFSVRDSVRECPVGDYNAEQLTELLRKTEADVIVNCLGLLQAVLGEGDIHDAFVARLITALKQTARPALLVHVSIPGSDADDRTDFAVTKRSADRRIVEAGLPYVILRPGFVVAPAAYGGSALLRALAVSPFDLPRTESERPFAAVAVEDISETVAFLATRVEAGETRFAAVWDLM
ncbi:MAG TPA: NAD(P)H-binding protein, partial [Xanthobacteraceae bacterium]|nr:NAD(P)H-binding protein [Xanthobacteraceae bacterium]